MNDQSETLTQRQAIERVVAEMDGPMELEEFTRHVLALWPSTSKNAKGSIRQTLRYDINGNILLFLDQKILIPMRLAMRGVRFRILLTRQELNKGVLFTYPAFQFMASRDLPAEDFQLEEADEHSIPVNPVKVISKVKSIFGTEEIMRTAFDLKWWYKKHSLKRGDSLLVTILDWEQGRFRLEPEPARTRQRHNAEIQTRNQRLVDHIFEQLEAERYESIRGSVAIPTAYFQLKDPNAYPADHWLEVLERDQRMQWTRYEIRYADWMSPFDAIMKDFDKQPAPTIPYRKKPISKQEAKQVYRFKAMLWHNRRIWRRIEIQAGQTLADFDVILRTAFQHDTSDHLSGFWKLVRRGQSRRFREVDLGTINPFEGGDAADIQVASLSLEPKDALKFVYDFGDWIEHRLELEAINEPEENVSYPRIIGQNKPRYAHCEICSTDGRKTIAIWFCYDCSNEKQREFLLCDDCMEMHDEEHYLEEILY